MSLIFVRWEKSFAIDLMYEFSLKYVFCQKITTVQNLYITTPGILVTAV